MAKTTEERLTRCTKTGRIFFSVADGLGTAGKALIQVGAILLLTGFVSAIGASIQQYRAEKLKRKVIIEKRNKAA